MANVFMSLSEATRHLRTSREALADALARLTEARDATDAYQDKIREFRTIHDTSRTMIASAMPVSTDEVWAIVSGSLHELIKKTSNPSIDEVNDRLQELDDLAEHYHDLAREEEHQVRLTEVIVRNRQLERIRRNFVR